MSVSGAGKRLIHVTSLRLIQLGSCFICSTKRRRAACRWTLLSDGSYLVSFLNNMGGGGRGEIRVVC